MFTVKKARSNNTEVEFVKVDVKAAIEYMLDKESENIIDKDFNKHIINEYVFPISPKAEIALRKFVTRKKKAIQGYNIMLRHLAFVSERDGEPIYWPSGIEFNKDGHMKKGFNYGGFRDGFSKQTEFYIVFDGGFNAENMYKNPYFLSRESFDYIYKAY